MNGKGVFKYFDGNEYSGEFTDGMMNGKGVFTFSDGNSYEGEYEDGEMHGEGIFTFAVGSVFQGSFQNDRMVSGVLSVGDEVYNVEFSKDDLFTGISSVYDATLVNNGVTKKCKFQNGKLIEEDA